MKTALLLKFFLDRPIDICFVLNNWNCKNLLRRMIQKRTANISDRHEVE